MLYIKYMLIKTLLFWGFWCLSVQIGCFSKCRCSSLRGTEGGSLRERHQVKTLREGEETGVLLWKQQEDINHSWCSLRINVHKLALKSGKRCFRTWRRISDSLCVRGNMDEPLSKFYFHMNPNYIKTQEVSRFDVVMKKDSVSVWICSDPIWHFGFILRRFI